MLKSLELKQSQCPINSNEKNKNKTKQNVITSKWIEVDWVTFGKHSSMRNSKIGIEILEGPAALDQNMQDRPIV